MTGYRPYEDMRKPGRFDTEGEWWACDPYPTWFRWEGPNLIRRYIHGRWLDEVANDLVHDSRGGKDGEDPAVEDAPCY